MDRTIVVTDGWVNSQLVPGMMRKRLQHLIKRLISETPILSSWLFPVSLVTTYAEVLKIIKFELSTEEILLDHSKILECKNCSSAKQDLRPIIDRLTDFQAFMYMTEAYYRDHILHQIRVAVLGDYLLTQIFAFPQPKSLVNLASELLDMDEEEVRRCWWIAALFHDIGMPIARLNENLEVMISDMVKAYELDFMLPSRSILNLQSTPKNTELLDLILNRFSGNVKELIKNASGLRGGSLDHGVIGALSLLATVSRNSRSTEKLYLEAAYAICAHSLNGLSLSFEDNPLGFLLVICDEMQEWNRDVKAQEPRGFRPLAQKVRLTKSMTLTLSEIEVHGKIVFEDQKGKDRCGFQFDKLVEDKRQNLARLSQDIPGFPSFRITLVDRVFHENIPITEIAKEIRIT